MTKSTVFFIKIKWWSERFSIIGSGPLGRIGPSSFNSVAILISWIQIDKLTVACGHDQSSWRKFEWCSSVLDVVVDTTDTPSTSIKSGTTVSLETDPGNWETIQNVSDLESDGTHCLPWRYHDAYRDVIVSRIVSRMVWTLDSFFIIS